MLCVSISGPYSLLGRAMEVYSRRAVIKWRHPNLASAQLKAKNKDHPKLMCHKVLLSVEGVVSLNHNVNIT